ncbi:TonB-dependent receptor [Paraflavisolibacter sp. H34]|uniref:TonB-dependent receptor n=1 Tax=Huijunlia imazamoxiresistens TaxID=3127457 RepID=UPI003018E402
MKLSFSCLFLFSFLGTSFLVEAQSGTVRGVVQDNASGKPLAFATVVLVPSAARATTTDSAGNFVLAPVPLGRYEVQVSHTGYEPALFKEVVVSAVKETFLEVVLEESVRPMEEVVVTAPVHKAVPLNKMALASARTLSVEEARRFAGGFDDPARLASSFAGVGSNVGHNGIVVRGNAPKFLQWKLEEVEIPNPNHFADVTGFGGGGLTALSSQVLGNSDFLTGAFPAEYGNALSGVFDMKLRNGNNQRPESAVQLGLIGVDVASEGPFRKGARSSYLFNYRYSTLALLSSLMPEEAAGTRYQDLSFKLHVPTKKGGTFSLWGLGLEDRSGQSPEADTAKWRYRQDKERQDVKQFMGALGLGHKISLGRDGFLKTTLAATVSGLDLHTERRSGEKLLPQNVIQKTNTNLVWSSYYNKKFSARHTHKTGIQATGLLYHMLLQEAQPAAGPLQTFTDEDGFSTLLSAYSHSAFQLSDKWLLQAGIYTQYFTRNGRSSIEPRLGARWQVAPKHTLALAYGLHSRLELLNYYFTRAADGTFLNKDLDFTRARHLVLSYNWNAGNNFHVRAEPYFQQLYHVPVIADSTYSFLNLQADWFLHQPLQSTGRGKNYGIDVTLEKFMSKGFYFMVTGSLFQARYAGGDGVWRNTRFNRNFLSNFLMGKEWMAGRGGQNVWNANLRVSYQGGDRYTPVNYERSFAQQEVVYREEEAFSKKLPPALLGHVTLSYKVNRERVAHEFALKVLNVTGYREYYGHRYNYKTQTVDENRERLMVPNVSYKIEF